MKIKIEKNEESLVTSLNGVGIDSDDVYILVKWYNDNFLPISDIDKLEYWRNGKWKEVELWENEESRRDPDEVYKDLEQLYLRGRTTIPKRVNDDQSSRTQ